MVHTVDQHFVIPPAARSSTKATQNSTITCKPSPSERIAALEVEISNFKAKQAAFIHSSVQKQGHADADESSIIIAPVAPVQPPSPTRHLGVQNPVASATLAPKQILTPSVSTLQLISATEKLHPSSPKIAHHSIPLVTSSSVQAPSDIYPKLATNVPEASLTLKWHYNDSDNSLIPFDTDTLILNPQSHISNFVPIEQFSAISHNSYDTEQVPPPYFDE